MDPFIVQTKFEDIKQKNLERCGSCDKQNIKQIIDCNIYHNIMEDCFRWHEKLMSCQTYEQRLEMEKFLLSQMEDGDSFSEFWRKSGYQFLISEMGLIDYDLYNIKKQEVLKIYDSIIV